MTGIEPPFHSSGAVPLCGDCPDCLDRTNRLLRVAPATTLLPGTRPTAAALEKHAKKYGPGMVAETAADYGLHVAMEREAPRRKAQGLSLKKRVAGHIEAGFSVEVIAEIEDLTPGRARRLVEELS